MLQDAQIQKLEAKNVSLTGSIKKMEQQLKNKEQMGEVCTDGPMECVSE